MVLKCKILRRLDLTSRLKIEYLAGHQTEIFFRKLYSNSIKRRCLYIHACVKYEGYILEVVDRM